MYIYSLVIYVHCTKIYIVINIWFTFFTNCLIVIIVWCVLTTYYIIAENGSENYTLHLLPYIYARKAGKWLTTEKEQ